MKQLITGRILLVAFALVLISCRSAESTAAGGLPDFTRLVEDNAAAVVNISTTRESSGSLRAQQMPDIFRHFFGEGMPDMPRESEAQGSGFIISGDGYVLTNYHVVGEADRILVRLQDRRELEAELVGFDERSDLALLKIEGQRLPAVTIGSSQNMKVGEWVLAIGAPFGFESTVTAGIVSAKGRSLPSENYVPFIQTDVAINPGNSGGPLFNLQGEVVGINSQIVSRSGGFMGLSFAIPIDIAMDVVQQLKETGRVARGWLGVLIQEVNRDLAESFDLEKPAGALIAQVMEDTPAEQAGFQPGDVVLRFNGEEIETSAMLPHVVGLLPPGTRTTADIVRDGKRMTLDVEVGELPDEPSATRASRKSPEAGSRLGISVTALTSQEREALGVGGVKVIALEEGPARAAGIRRGDVIETLNNQPVHSPESFAEVVETLPTDRRVPVLIHRGGSPRFLAIRLQEGE